MKKIKTTVKRLIYFCQVVYIKRLHRKLMKKIFDSHRIHIEHESFRAIRCFYKKYNINVDKIYYKYFLAAGQEITYRYIPEWVFRFFIEPFYNNKQLVNAWADKNYFDKILESDFLPTTVFRNVNGVFLDKNYNIISIEEAVNILQDNKSYIIKPSILSGNGRKIGTIHGKDVNLIKQYQKDYIVQEKIKPNKLLGAFNENIITDIRIVTFKFENEVHILARVVTIEPDDKSKYRYIFVPIDEEGNFAEYGVTETGDKLVECNGIAFKDNKLPNVSIICNELKKLHNNKLLHFGIVSWDVIIDEKDRPVIVEYNIRAQGIFKVQGVCGPLFGDLTERVFDEVFKKEKKSI